MSVKEIKEELSKVFSDLLNIQKGSAWQFLPGTSRSAGKLYEAYILSVICKKLKEVEGCSLVLRNGRKILLKTGGGPINKNYPWIEVKKDDEVIGEIFTDIYFNSMSYCESKSKSGAYRKPTSGEYHELDIVMLKKDAQNGTMPEYDQILIGVECKDTRFQKNFLRGVLGVRREMGLLRESSPTIFSNWPFSKVNSEPVSCLLLYSSSSEVNNYTKPGNFFGIGVFHETM